MSSGAPLIPTSEVAVAPSVPVAAPPLPGAGPVPAARTVGVRQAIGGGVWVLLSEGMMLPVGMVVAVYFTWRLKDTGYGLFALTLAVVTWVEYSLTSMFARATIRVVAEASDWRAAAATAVRAQFLTSLAVGAGLWAGAGVVAQVLNEPQLGGHLRWLAWDVPLMGLGQGCRCVLIGTGRFGPRAAAGAGRAVGRLAFAIMFVEMGLGVRGAVVSCLGASVMEIVVCWFYLGELLILRRGSHGVLGRVMEAAGPLLVASLCNRLLERLDLLVLKMMGATVELAGVYGAGQNLAFVPLLVATAISPVALWGVSGAMRQGDAALARRMAREALRAALLVVLPLSATLAGAGPGIVALLYPSSFAPAGALLSFLALATAGMVLNTVSLSILFAAAHPRWAIVLSAPLPLVAVVAQVLLIPRYGVMGAAAGTLIASGTGVGIALVSLWRVLGITMSGRTAARAVLAAGMAYAIGWAWPARGPMVVAEFCLAALAAAGMLIVTGEFSAPERAAAVDWLRGLRPVRTREVP